MAKVNLPYPPINKRIAANGFMDPELRTWLVSVYNVLGGSNGSTNSQVKENINQNSNDIEDVRKNVNINSDNINILDSSVDELDKEVETLQNESSTNATNILATVKALDQLTTTVQNLNTELQTLENTVNNLTFKAIITIPTYVQNPDYAGMFVYIQDQAVLMFTLDGYTFKQVFPAV